MNSNSIILTIILLITGGLISGAVYHPSQKNKSPLSSFKHIIIGYVERIQKILISMFNFINPFPYQSLLLQIFICYIIFFSVFITHPYPLLKRWPKTTDTILISILITLFLAVFIQFNVPFAGEEKNPPGFKVNKKHFKHHIPPYLIFICIVSLIILIGLGISYLAANYTDVSYIFYTLLIISIAVWVFYFIYSTLNKIFSLNLPSLKKILYTLIFFITHRIFPPIQKSIKDTPYIVYLVLFIEFFLITSYIILPIIANWLYLLNPGDKDRDELLGVRLKNTQKSISEKEELIKDMKGGVDLNWSEIPTLNDDDLQIKLYDLGFTTSNIDSIIKMVRDNQDAVISSEMKVSELKSTLKQLEKEQKLDNRYTSTLLLKDPVYTDKITAAGNFKDLIDSDFHVYQYTLSSWVFIHGQGPNHNNASNTFTSLLNYGNKPNILYNIKKQTLQIKMLSGNKETIIYETQNFPLQKWNNIVINYDKGTLDIFINSKLVSSTPEIVPYMVHENITIGEQDGISGGIANITYYTGNLSPTQIELFYNILKNQDTPTFP